MTDSVVTSVRAAELRRDEEEVLAESALQGERAVAAVRLGVMALRGLTQVGIASSTMGLTIATDPLRRGAVIAYAMFALATLVGLMRARFTPRSAAVVPTVITAIDFGYLFFMGAMFIQHEGSFRAEMTGMSCALTLAFSVARFRWWHVAFSTALACATYASLVLIAGGEAGADLRSLFFVLGGYVGLGVIVGWTQRQIGRMFLDLRRRENLSRFLPRQVAARVLRDGAAALAPTQREVTILFSDIRDFTTLSEKLAPRDVLQLLDGYFEAMTQVVKGHDGIVNKFLGDGMLAVWGVPDADERHAEKALRAALDMRRALDALNQERLEARLQPLRIGIGVHTGQVAAGMLGGAEQHEYTVIGDAVNLASRIEGLNKQLGTDILVTETAWQRGGSKFRGRRVGQEKVKGRAEEVVVYSLEGGAETAT